MANPARFTFDLDLQNRPAKAAPTVPEDLVGQLVRQARDEGYAEGFAAGEQSATARAAQTLAAAASQLAGHTAEMSAALEQSALDARREAVELAASIARKLAVHLLARQPTAELQALIAECMANLAGVPHLVIRCHPELADGIREIATTQMATSGFTGRLIVMGDPEQRLGDGRLEWADGGLVRDINAISRDIDEKIASYLATFGAAASEGTHP